MTENMIQVSGNEVTICVGFVINSELCYYVWWNKIAVQFSSLHAYVLLYSQSVKGNRSF